MLRNGCISGGAAYLVEAEASEAMPLWITVLSFRRSCFALRVGVGGKQGTERGKTGNYNRCE